MNHLPNITPSIQLKIKNEPCLILLSLYFLLCDILHLKVCWINDIVLVVLNMGGFFKMLFANKHFQ